ncbi:MAG: hypothetical protein U9N46_06980 [Euryarchaeota archaeon]|nr:hypothetical protein [Euryarchaeota archaeon]
MVSWMCNNAKTRRRDGAKNKNLLVYFTGIFDCAFSGIHTDNMIRAVDQL